MWRRARQRFLEVSEAVEAEFAFLREYEAAIQDTHTLARDLGLATAEAERLALDPSDDVRLRDRVVAVEAIARRAQEALARHLAAEPPQGEGASYVRWTMWDADREGMANEAAGLARKAERLREAAAQAGTGDGVSAALADARGRVTELEDALAHAHAVVERGWREVGERTVDHGFFARGHEAWNLSAPWMSDALHRRREELFDAAMEVHTAFAAAAAGRLMQNLAHFAEVMGQAATPLELDAYLPDLWSSLFMVVPVVSTTFASVGRMLEGVRPGTLGWLVVDEAGQALPQAAVGAVMRCRRALVVGDPLQIEPVDTLPRRLSNRLCEYFAVEPRLWVGPWASVQSLADRASPLVAVLGEGDAARGLGMPLLVHRRCQEPMFGISNGVAYDGQMVFASGSPPPGPWPGRSGIRLARRHRGP